MQKLDFQSQDLELKIAKVKSQIIRLSLVRLVFFLGTGAFLILGLAENALWLGLVAILGYFFVKVIQQFNFYKDQEAVYLELGKIVKNRDLRRARNLTSFDSGLEFAEKNHPFSGDLDLFGEHSLFQLLDHTGSQGGKATLAKRMKSSFDFSVQPSNAEAIRDLAGKPVFLESMEASVKAFPQDAKDRILWKKWLEQPHRISWILVGLAGIGPLVGLGILISVIQGWVEFGVLGLWVLAGIFPLTMVFSLLQQAGESIPTPAQLKSWRIRAHLIEQESFTSATLNREKLTLQDGDTPLSEQIESLDRLGLWVQNRMNLLYIPLNLIFWTDLFLAVRLVRWKAKVGKNLSQLTERLQTWEMWVSLGAFEYELGGKGEVCLQEDQILEVQDLSHPLILPEKSISNSVEFADQTRLILLTGANMSGKTTFMRALGINCVLIHLGLSPFAKSVTLGDFKLFTSMRNSDNLGESVSSFYAELSRIRQLIERLEAGERIFFLLDEILKGTNTQDRISGSKALIHQILQTHGFGIISTHDIELSELGKTEESVHNFSFHSEINNESIQFDYTLKKGPCPSFNAHKLMELMGIRFTEK